MEATNEIGTNHAGAQPRAAEGGANLSVGLDGAAVLVIGVGIVAWFADPEQGHEWATENHFGNWLMHPYRFDDSKPLFTSEQIAAAEKRGKELQAVFRSKPLAA